MPKKYTLNQIYDTVKSGEYPIIDKEDKLIVIIKDEDKTARIYKIVSEYPLLAEELIVDFEPIAERLAVGLDAKGLIIEALRKAPPNDVVEIQERLEKPDAAVKPGPGCYSIKIGGKPGRPIELVIVE